MSKIEKILISLTAILFIYTAYFYIDQSFQSGMVVNSKLALKTPTSAVYNPADGKLKNLGFSNTTIQVMTPNEKSKYSDYKGKVVGKDVTYFYFQGDNVRSLSKASYEKMIGDIVNGWSPYNSQFLRANLVLTQVGPQKYMFIGEYQMDYNSSSLLPAQLEFQFRSEYMLDTPYGKQSWWLNPEWNSQKFTYGSKVYKYPNGEPVEQQNDMLFGFGDSTGTNSQYYNVEWKRPVFMKDAVGYHFFTVATFEMPKDWLVAEVYLQGQNPHLSQCVQYFIDDKK